MTNSKPNYMAERLEKAHAIAEFTDLYMTEIALACGFVSCTTLSQRYKRRFGRTPVDQLMKQSA
ncbi:helix-turn-helix domain-containing protein [Ruegeria faecimaris]|uniref:helix-turn-helix domain-containing protein n=2 Tax=Ruegeria faecimaris TaxID=686389 RepID=UPI003CD0CD96